jgi:hypothetical protein
MAQRIRVPAGRPVMIDGKFGEQEWDDAVVCSGKGYRVFIKTFGGYLAVCFQSLTADNIYTELYLDDGKTERVLHASAKLGERTYADHRWSAETWWNNVGWTANVSHIDDVSKGTFIPGRIREYQIKTSTIRGDHLRLFIRAGQMSADAKWSAGFPAGGDAENTKSWLAVYF